MRKSEQGRGEANFELLIKLLTGLHRFKMWVSLAKKRKKKSQMERSFYLLLAKDVVVKMKNFIFCECLCFEHKRRREENKIMFITLKSGMMSGKSNLWEISK